MLHDTIEDGGTGRPRCCLASSQQAGWPIGSAMLKAWLKFELILINQSGEGGFVEALTIWHTPSTGVKPHAILLEAGIFSSRGGVRCVMTDVDGFPWAIACGWR